MKQINVPWSNLKYSNLHDLVGRVQDEFRGVDFRCIRWEPSVDCFTLTEDGVFSEIQTLVAIEQGFNGSIFLSGSISGKSFEHLLYAIRLNFPGYSFQRLTLINLDILYKGVTVCTLY